MPDDASRRLTNARQLLAERARPIARRVSAAISRTYQSVAEFARKMELSETAVHKWAKGQAEPSAEALLKMHALGINPLYVLGVSGWMWADNDEGRTWADSHSETPLGREADNGASMIVRTLGPFDDEFAMHFASRLKSVLRYTGESPARFAFGIHEDERTVEDWLRARALPNATQLWRIYDYGYGVTYLIGGQLPLYSLSLRGLVMQAQFETEQEDIRRQRLRGNTTDEPPIPGE